ncbi:BZ3500_MvSof-1268-A1-R1_Chr3-1g05946 [Microbotryum saponariae]|uniref:BZ3500_MvSof-1268-A1-R1_Chr3-1g05946 protein n=1 Tax=Microbotryum saponariae TaxID=289078 RepID=A0A2X0KYR5_9BASI|nr:BZ3500_MvSof-1268-A1-R1_Chr3-1g05946 [Microbotryum saponariae]SDA05136.1 BZ3501_MvSof-1269-A2-R1_Chr3-1g05616 [Microbotryum saponariae]
MPTRFSKTRKHRGHVSAGHGRVGKHRKHPGGRGLAGGQHHHRTNFDKYHYGYFGKVGMRHFHKNKAALWRPVVNCDKLASTTSYLEPTLRSETWQTGNDGTPDSITWARETRSGEVEADTMDGSMPSLNDVITDTSNEPNANIYLEPIVAQSLIPEAQRKGLSADSAVVPVVDTLAAGYGKVLAKGRLPAFPIILKARYVSRRAEQKIVEAGGVVSIVA